MAGHRTRHGCVWGSHQPRGRLHAEQSKFEAAASGPPRLVGRQARHVHTRRLVNNSFRRMSSEYVSPVLNPAGDVRPACISLDTFPAKSGWMVERSWHCHARAAAEYCGEVAAATYWDAGDRAIYKRGAQGFALQGLRSLRPKLRTGLPQAGDLLRSTGFLRVHCSGV